MTLARARLLSLLAVVVALVAPLAGTPVEAAPAKPRAPHARLADRVEFGAYVDGMTLQPSRLRDFETLVRDRADIASYYWGFGDVFPGAVEHSFADEGRRKVLVSWDMGPTRFTEWSGGRHDAYLATLVERALAYPYDLYVRPWPEMNGDWQDFQPTEAGEKRYGGTYAEFRTAWRYVVDYFRSRGATNLKWVFNPTVDTYAETTPVERIFPGEAYVDVLGLDGFNWGKDSGWGRWLSFEEVFAAQYRRLVALHGTAPVWICEVASKEPAVNDGAPKDPSRSKAQWIRSAFASTAFPRVRALVWFQALKERDWRVNSSTAALKAIRESLG